MANALLSPDQDQDERLNKGQEDYDERFNAIAKAEESATFNDIVKDNDLGSAEANASSGTWQNNYGTDGGAASVARSTAKKVLFKKATPIIGAGGVVALLGILFMALTAPSLLFVQLKETMMGRFNSQLSALESRSNRLLHAKVNGGTKGYCGATVTIKCKFSSLPDKHVKRLEAAGVTLKDPQTKLGRTTFSAYIINGKEVSAQDFYKEVGLNKQLRSALRSAYSPLTGGFRGKGWERVASRTKIKKRMPELGAAKDVAEAQKNLNSIGKEGTPSAQAKVRAGCTGDDCGSDSWTKEDEERIKNQTDTIESESGEGKAAAGVRKTLSNVGGGAIGGTLKLTGVADNACLLYGAVNTLSFAVKTIRNAQMIRFAMVFMTTADSIKAGVSPDPKDIEFLGKNITTVIKDPSDPSKNLVNSGTDSFGYRYAAYGDSGGSSKSTSIANRFMAGGGFAGELNTNVNSILAMVPGGRGALKGTCATLANPFVQAGSIIAGVAMLFVPGVNVAKVAIQGAISATVAATITILPDLIADTLAGTVTENIVGEESMNAITSGFGSLSSQVATENGVSVMTKDQAIAYNNLLTETKNEYIAMERESRSPLDPTSPYTFTGSIVSSLLPIVHTANKNPVTMIGSLISTSFTGLLPKASALDGEKFSKALNSCTDLDLIDAGVATDPFCNTINGIPPQYLGKDPIVVIDELGDQLSDMGKPQGAYKDFISKCIESGNPYGYHDNGDSMLFDTEKAKECIINDSNANYYLHYIDNRMDENMDLEDKKSSNIIASGDWSHPLGGAKNWTTYEGNSHGKGAIDFPEPEGTPVYAASEGTVTTAGWDDSYGNHVIIKHGDGSATLYAHFVSSPSVKAGDTVSASQQIGSVGTTGNSTGNHLHFETRNSIEWGSITPAYPFMLERGVDLGPCVEGPCSLGGYSS